VALGVVSYGVYLFHWPVAVLVDADRTGLDGFALALLQVSLALVAAATSYRLVERPVRHGWLGQRMGRWSLAVFPASALAVVAALVWGTAPPVLAPEAAASGTSGASGAPHPDALRVVLLGDSVAESLAGGVTDEEASSDWTPAMSPFDRAEVDLASVAKQACTFLGPAALRIGDGAVQEWPLEANCGDWHGDLERALDAAPPDVLLVALENDKADHLVEGEFLRFDSTAHEQLLAAFHEDLRQEAAARGARLVILLLPPRGAPADGVLPGWNDEHWREQAMAAQVARFAAEHDDVDVLDLAAPLCPDGDCEAPVDGFDPRWRYDGMHFTPDGVAWVARWLEEELTGGS
jgi:hypothetical protein